MAVRFALLFLLCVAVYAEEAQETTTAEATASEDNELEDPWELDLPTLIDSKMKDGDDDDDDDDENDATSKAPRYMTRLFRALTNPRDVGEGKGNLKRNLPRICYLGHGPFLVPGRRGSAKFLFNTSIEGEGVDANAVFSARLLLKFVLTAGRRLPDSSDRVQVTVSRIKKERKGGRVRLAKVAQRSVSTRKVSSYVEFDLKNVVKSWLNEPKKNFGLLVTVGRGGKGSIIQIPTEKNDPNGVPLLVVVLGAAVSPRLRRERGASRSADRVRRDGLTEVHVGAREYPRRQTSCQLKSFWVDIKQANWNFIIAPRRYDASVCVGECEAPLLGSDNPATHGIILSSLPKRLRKEIPGQCCVPIEYTSISLLIYTRSDLVAYKPFPDIKATKCGCR